MPCDLTTPLNDNPEAGDRLHGRDRLPLGGRRRRRGREVPAVGAAGADSSAARAARPPDSSGMHLGLHCTLA